MVSSPSGGVSKPRIRVLVVDDHQLVREGIRYCVASQPDLEVAGEAEGFDDAMTLLAREPVDVVVLDMRMPGVGGVDATRMIRSSYPSVRVLILTAFPDHVAEAFNAGASGFVLKSARSEGLLAAIRSVYLGATVIQDPLLESLGVSASKPSEASPLSPRELEVIRLLARGLSNRAIAFELGIGPRTADQHVHSIFVKTGVKSRTAAVRYALDQNLATPSNMW
ncbi:MAG: response regulator [Candidatus Dormibacteria bacterium]